MTRKWKIIFGLTEAWGKLVDEHVEMFFEERPWLWEMAGITEARPNLKEKMRENEKQQKITIDEIQKHLTKDLTDVKLQIIGK